MVFSGEQLVVVMCGLIDCCRDVTLAVRRRAMFCRLVAFLFVYAMVMTLRFTMVAGPIELQDEEAEDRGTSTKRLTPSTLDAADLRGGRNQGVSVVHVVSLFGLLAALALRLPSLSLAHLHHPRCA